MRGRIPVENLKRINQSLQLGFLKIALTLCPEATSASRIMRSPLHIGGCGLTIPSCQWKAIFNGWVIRAEPSAFALADEEATCVSFQGILATFGSRSHGSVESIDFISSSIASSEVLKIPTDEG